MFAFHQPVISTVVWGCLRFFFGLLGLFDPVTRDVELEDDAVMNQAVNSRCRGRHCKQEEYPHQILPCYVLCNGAIEECHGGSRNLKV